MSPTIPPPAPSIKIRKTAFTDIAMEAGCALSADGKPQAGMGISAADYDLDGNLDLVKTNFAGDTPSLYRNLGNANFEDTTFQAGSANTPSISAGAAASSTWTTTAGPTFLFAMATSTRKSSNSRPKRATRSANCFTKISATAVSPMFPTTAAQDLHSRRRARLRLRRLRQ